MKRACEGVIYASGHEEGLTCAQIAADNWILWIDISRARLSFSPRVSSDVRIDTFRARSVPMARRILRDACTHKHRTWAYIKEGADSGTIPIDIRYLAGVVASSGDNQPRRSRHTWESPLPEIVACCVSRAHQEHRKTCVSYRSVGLNIYTCVS